MMCLIILAAFFIAATSAAASTVKAPVFPTTTGSYIIPNEYIVVFKKDVNNDTVQNHTSALTDMLADYNGTYAIKDHYHIDSFRGYFAFLNDKLLDEVRSFPEVAFVEKNQEVYKTLHPAFDSSYSRPAGIQQASCVVQMEAPWGLARTTSRRIPARADYPTFPFLQGQGVHIYIIDTGIETSHPDFEGRAIWGADFIDSPSPRTDLNGHGTHVAGTAIGKTYGMAKKARAVAVRVLDGNGRGSVGAVISGINWVVRNRQRKSVINLSVGSRRSFAFNNAADGAVRQGIHVSVAAGNDRRNACLYSPAGAPLVMTVTASDRTDTFARFSNWGNCVDIIAPGVGVTSAWLRGGIITLDGTSMASPHVAGVMAKAISGSYNPTPAQLKNLILQGSTKGKIRSITPPFATNNYLVFMQCF